jgi:hypothetical protein
VWRHGSWDAEWRFFETRAQALADAPDDRVFSIVDVTVKPRTPFPTIGEIVGRTRRMLAPESGNPYPVTRKGERSWV